jgi:outer membrane protein with beta-barrel domain
MFNNLFEKERVCMSSRARICRDLQRSAVRVAVGLGMALAGYWGCAPAALAMEGDSQWLIYVGSDVVYIDNVESTGTLFGARYGYEFHDDLLWTIGANFGATDGTNSVAGKTYNISTNTSTLQTGLLYYFGRDGKKWLIPFVGGGLGVLDYNVDYRYPGSKVGKTSGTGPGGFAFAGLEFWLAQALTVIVSYDVEGYQISTQSHGSDTLETGGLILAVRLNF